MTRTQATDLSAHPGVRSARVVAVVVGYNREALLQDCLDALAAQTRRLDAVVVIDNASTDATGQVADHHPIGADVMHLSRNVGGAGGFAAGIARALIQHHADWVWVMDDDTIPRPEALSALLDVLAASELRLSVLSSRAVWTDGRDHPMNSPRTRIGATRLERQHAATLGCRPIRTASYVSALMNADDIRRLGLPWADYFIWSDDFEHTGRLLRTARGVHVPASIVEHRTKAFGGAGVKPGGRFYYDVRNRLWALGRTGSFSSWERLLYGGRSALGWLQVILRDGDGALGTGLRGLRDGLRRGPRPSADVLAADPEAATDIRAVERSAGRA